MTDGRLCVQSFQDVLKDLATLCRHDVCVKSNGHAFQQLTEATEQQRRILELLQTTC